MRKAAKVQKTEKLKEMLQNSSDGVWKGRADGTYLTKVIAELKD